MASPTDALRRVDNAVESVLHTVSRVAVYKFDDKDQKWLSPEIQGPMFVCKRSAAPFFAMYYVNQLDNDIPIHHITPRTDLDMNDNHFMYRTDDDQVYCVWFHDDSERDQTYAAIERCKNNDGNPEAVTVQPAPNPSSTAAGVANNPLLAAEHAGAGGRALSKILDYMAITQVKKGAKLPKEKLRDALIHVLKSTDQLMDPIFAEYEELYERKSAPSTTQLQANQQAPSSAPRFQ